MSLIVKLLEDHSPGCFTRRDPKQARQRRSGARLGGISVADSPWHFDIDKSQVFWRDAAGGGRGRAFKWLFFTCGDTRCGAHGLVRLDSVGAAITEALGGVR